MASRRVVFWEPHGDCPGQFEILDEIEDCAAARAAVIDALLAAAPAGTTASIVERDGCLYAVIAEAPGAP